MTLTLSQPAPTELLRPRVATQSTLFLDGLRGLAAVYVLMRHVSWMPALPHSGPAWRHVRALLEEMFRYGHLGVVFFFVLSGFVIHLRYAKQLRQDARGASLGVGNFVFRRVRRLYPPLLAAIFFTWLFDWAGTTRGFDAYYNSMGQTFDFLPSAIRHNHTFSTLVGNLLFTMQMFVPAWGTDSPLWSLAYEWWFYMLYPLLWRLSRRSILLATGFVLLCFVATRHSGQWPQIQDKIYPFSGWNLLSLPRRVFAALPAWWCGVLLADVYAGRIRIQFKWLCPLILSIGVVFFHKAPEVIRTLGAAMGFCGVIAFGFYLQQKNVRLTLLNKLSILGDFSYTLYVTHWPIVVFLTALWATRVSGKFSLSAPVGFVAITLMPIGFAYLLHLLVEKPFSRQSKSKRVG